MPAKAPKQISVADAFTMLGEKIKTQAKRPNIYGYVPHAKQIKFHSTNKRKVRLYIGGNRSGKTVGGIVESLWYATKRHPYFDINAVWDEPIRGRIVSVDFVNGIEKIIKPEVARWVPPSDLRGGSWSTAYDKLERTLHFANGSFIEFMSYDQDLDKFAGTSRHFIHFDEEPPQDVYTECMARLVDTGGHAWITMTPVEGMTWVFEFLYEPGISGEADYIEVVEVSMTENPHLNEVEVAAFLDSLDADERKAREHGKFVQLGGLIYKNFDPEVHVIEEFAPPKDWLWVASLDHGFNNPTAWLWHAVGPDGQTVTFEEHYASGMTIDEHARAVHAINAKLGRPPDYYIGDPSIRNTDPITGTSIHEEYIKYGIPIMLANNDVAAGIVRVARYLKPRSDGKPNLVFTRKCVNLIREMRKYRWKVYANKKLQNANNAQEVPHKKDDHCPDSLRYFIMSRPELMADTPGSSGPAHNVVGAAVVYATERTVQQLNAPADTYDVEYAGYSTQSAETEWQVDEMMGAIW
jgi:phage terminase large subunit-like protein